MKRKILIWLTTALMLVCMLFGVGCKKADLKISKNSLALNLYDEVLLTVETDEEVEWSSSDEDIVKVNSDGLVMAQGVKGEATVKAKIKSGKAECEVVVRDRLIEPALLSNPSRAFVNGVSDVDVWVSYNDVEYTPESLQIESLDEDIVVIENGKLKGVSEGETEVIVDATWKKWTASETVKVTVYGEKVMFLAENEVDIFDVPDDTVAKKNSYKVIPEVFVQGVLQSGAVALTQKSGEVGCVTITGDTVKVAENYTPDSDGERVEIEVKSDVDGVASQTLSVNVMPNYIEMNAMQELHADEFNSNVQLKIYDGADETITDDGTRTDIVDYTVQDDSNEENEVDKKKNWNASTRSNQTPTWANWTTRVELKSTMTKNATSAYPSLKEKGYKMLSFDVYYTNVNGADSLHGMFFGMNGSSSYFRTDSQNNRDDILIVNKYGEITNTLKANEWQTVYYDIDKLAVACLVAGKDGVDAFISCNYVNNTAYIDNLRYWYDTTEIEKYEDKRDMAVRTLVQDSENTAKYIAPANEFIAFSPNTYVAFTQSELDGVDCYKYDNANAGKFEIETKSKINAYNDLNGNAVKQGYEYIAFDIYVESGENLVVPKLAYYDLYKQASYPFMLKDGEKIQSSCLRLFADGKEIYEFKSDAWVSVVLRIDGKAKDNFHITAIKDFGTAEGGDEKSSVFYLKNTNYYKDNSFFNEYAFADLLRAKCNGLDAFYYVNDTFNVREILDVRFGGEKTFDYEIVSVEVGEVCSYNGETGVITANVLGVSNVSVALKKTVDGVTHEYTLSFTLNIVPDNRIELRYNALELYSGTGDFALEKSHALSVKAYQNQTLVDADKVRYEILSGAEFVALENGVVSAKTGAAGEAEIRVCLANDESVAQTIKVVTFNVYRARGNDEFVWGNRKDENITYGEADGAIGGREGVYKYYASNANTSWDDRLMIYESGHKLGEAIHEDIVAPYSNATEAFNNLTKKNIDYITFDMYLTAGSVMRVNAPERTGVKDQRNYYQAGKAVGEVQPTYYNDNVALYDGNKVLKKGETVQANTWYTVVVDHRTAKLVDGWSAVYLTGGGTVYLDNVRYYHDASWMDDFAVQGKLELSVEIAESYFETESVELQDIVTLTYLRENVEASAWSVEIADTTLASYDEATKKIRFLEVGTTDITVTATYNMQVSGTAKVTVTSAVTLMARSVVCYEEQTFSVTDFATAKHLGKETQDGEWSVETGYDSSAISYDETMNRVKFLKSGATTFTLKVDIDGKSAELIISVTVKKATGITLTSPDNLYEATTWDLNEFADASYWGQTATDVEWSVEFSDNTIASFDSETNKITFIKAGETDITVTAVVNGKSASATISVFVGKKDRIETEKDFYELWDSAVITGESFPSETDVLANVFVNNEAVQDGTFTIVGYDGDDIVELIDGKTLRAKAQGKAIVTIAYEENTEIFAEISVRVYGNYKAEDGSELMMLRTQDATYELATETVNGRTGVYKYTDANAGTWQDRLAVYESAHPVGITNSAIPFVNSVEAFNNMVTKNYKYVTIDVSLASGAFLRVESMNKSTQDGNSSRRDYKVGETISSQTQANDCISIYERGAKLASTYVMRTDRWYTIIIDREHCKAPTSGDIWSAINFVGSTGTIYFDNVRYYFNDSCYDDYAYADKDGYVGYDGSELVWGTKSDTEERYSLETEAIASRTGVYKYNPNGTGWSDKLMVYESGHSLGGANVTSFPYPDAAAAYDNLTNKGYNYITVDICFTENSLIRICSPKSATEADKQNVYKVGVAPSATDTTNILNPDFIKLYDMDGNEVTTAVQAGVWYTVWFNHIDTVRMSGQWSALHICGQGVTYFDNVRYYNANPFA